MEAIDLLQQVGLNKYEAVAYYSLLAEGPLTGYELGKRSEVPLSRSYEILERLSSRGLALLQPGDPLRYRAQDYDQFLAGIRARSTQTIDTLGTLLSTVAAPQPAGSFWVARGQANVQAQARGLIASARARLDGAFPNRSANALADVLATAPPGRRILLPPDTEPVILLLADNQRILAGTLSSAYSCEALIGDHPATQVLLRAYFAAPASSSAQPAVHMNPTATADWVDWETRKQRHLWQLSKTA
jgi:hypothetical protein